MIRTIAVMNQKGGVGKTSTTLGLAAAIAQYGGRVLVIDMDPQSNASETLVGDYSERLRAKDLYTTYHLLDEQAEPSDTPDTITASTWDGIDVIPASGALAKREKEAGYAKERRLMKMLRGVPAHYDVILLDCPPSVGDLAAMCLAAATEVLLVAEAERYSIKALGEMDKTVNAIGSAMEHDFKILGLVANKVEAHTRTGRDMLEWLKNHYGDSLLAVIPKRTAVAAAALAGKSVFEITEDGAADMQFLYRHLARKIGADRFLRAAG